MALAPTYRVDTERRHLWPPLIRTRTQFDLNQNQQRQGLLGSQCTREQQLLYLKSRYMTPELPGYESQKQFDDALVKLGLFDFAEYGPSADVFESSLGRAGYSINGFALQNARKVLN
jgi:hypothetical protein